MCSLSQFSKLELQKQSGQGSFLEFFFRKAFSNVSE